MLGRGGSSWDSSFSSPDPNHSGLSVQSLHLIVLRHIADICKYSLTSVFIYPVSTLHSCMTGFLVFNSRHLHFDSCNFQIIASLLSPVLLLKLLPVRPGF